MNTSGRLLSLMVLGLGMSGLLTACGPSASLSSDKPAVLSEVAIRPQVSGTIDRIGFAPGSRVKKGQILFRIDPIPFRAASERWFIARNHALAELEMARANRARLQRVPGQVLDPATTDALNSAVLAAAQRLAATTTALNESKIALESTEIRAPIDGTASRALIKQGEAVSNTSLLTTIVSDDSRNLS